jgi:hypothetical protein
MVVNQTQQRRLAAILAADVAGYSRLTSTDEEGTVARIRALRSELIDPAIAANRGRMVKTSGDGALVEFASVVDAVRCAIEIQRGLIVRNADFVPDKANPVSGRHPSRRCDGRTHFTYEHLAAASALAEKMDEAKTSLAEARRLNPKLTIKLLIANGVSPSSNLVDGLRKAGLPEQ